MRKVTNITSIVMILGYLAFLAIGWKTFPNEVPTHFSAIGVADSYGDKTSLFIEPAVMIGLFLLLAIVEHFPKISIVLICAFSGFMCIYEDFPSWPMIMMIVIILFTIAISVFRIYKCKLD